MFYTTANNRKCHSFIYMYTQNCALTNAKLHIGMRMHSFSYHRVKQNKINVKSFLSPSTTADWLRKKKRKKGGILARTIFHRVILNSTYANGFCFEVFPSRLIKFYKCNNRVTVKYEMTEYKHVLNALDVCTFT